MSYKSSLIFKKKIIISFSLSTNEDRLNIQTRIYIVKVGNKSTTTKLTTWWRKWKDRWREEGEEKRRHGCSEWAFQNHINQKFTCTTIT